MADPLGGLEKLVKLALSIKTAVETVRRNTMECYRIERRASRIHDILTKLQREGTEVVNIPEVSGVLEDLSETLGRALTLVKDCQKRDFVGELCTAGSMAMRLHEVREDMSDMMVMALFAINTSIIASSGVRPPPSSPEGEASHVVTYSRPDGGIVLRRRRVYRRRYLIAPKVPDNDFFWTTHTVSYHSVPYWREKKWERLSCTKFSLSELEAATHNFSEENLIGQQGAFITVYKGVLHDEGVVVIQKMQCHDNFDEEEIFDKVGFVLELKHKNIVQLLGYGFVEQMLTEVGDSNVEKDYVFLVEEYMANGSLDNIIYGSQYDWSSRLHLIQGIAHGLHYLHEQRIVHLNLKPKSILVDSDMNPKITDFSRVSMPRDVYNADVKKDTDYILPGTMGYMPPEYIMEGIVSEMYDVYSFGVILLEIISGMCRSEPTCHQSSIEWAWIVHIEGGRMEELLDLTLCSESQQKEARRCLEIGLLCTQSDKADRPTMLDVVEMLEYKKEVATPKQPKYIKPKTETPLHMCAETPDENCAETPEENCIES